MYTNVNLGRNASTNFSQYDSCKFSSFPESIKHAKANPLLIENLSDWREVMIDGEIRMIQEPTCLLKDQINMFDNVLIDTEIPQSEFYRPEITAKRFYACEDLWYIILLVNSMYSINAYNKTSIKIIPANELVRIEKFVRKAKQNIRPLDLSNDSMLILD
jgi:hypothetical protein